MGDAHNGSASPKCRTAGAQGHGGAALHAPLFAPSTRRFAAPARLAASARPCTTLGGAGATPRQGSPASGPLTGTALRNCRFAAQGSVWRAGTCNPAALAYSPMWPAAMGPKHGGCWRPPVLTGASPGGNPGIPQGWAAAIQPWSASSRGRHIGHRKRVRPEGPPASRARACLRRHNSARRNRLQRLAANNASNTDHRTRKYTAQCSEQANTIPRQQSTAAATKHCAYGQLAVLVHKTRWYGNPRFKTAWYYCTEQLPRDGSAHGSTGCLQWYGSFYMCTGAANVVRRIYLGTGAYPRCYGASVAVRDVCCCTGV